MGSFTFIQQSPPPTPATGKSALFVDVDGAPKYIDDTGTVHTFDGTNGNTLLTTSGIPSSGTGDDGDYAIDPAAQLIYGPKASGAWPAGVSYKGDAGTNGNTILSTTGAPSSGIGVDGDYALDVAAQLIYGPKAAGAWPAGVSIKGLTGAAGNTLLTTTGAPASGTGANGDYAIDPAAQLIYGPKASGAWPAGVSYKGATGTSLTRPAGTVSVSAGVATIDIASGAEVWVLPQLTANITSWVFTTLPAAGKYADLSILTQQGASTAYTVADPATLHHRYGAGGAAWVASTTLGMFETLGIRLWHDGTVERFASGVGG